MEELQPDAPPNKSSSATDRNSSRGKPPAKGADGPVDESDDGPVDESDDGPATAPGDIGED